MKFAFTKVRLVSKIVNLKQYLIGQGLIFLRRDSIFLYETSESEV